MDQVNNLFRIPYKLHLVLHILGELVLRKCRLPCSKHQMMSMIHSRGQFDMEDFQLEFLLQPYTHLLFDYQKPICHPCSNIPAHLLIPDPQEQQCRRILVRNQTMLHIHCSDKTLHAFVCIWLDWCLCKYHLHNMLCEDNNHMCLVCFGKKKYSISRLLSRSTIC